jgi:TatD DNase family protein
VTWVDSHCHLPAGADEADAILDRAHGEGVEWLVCVGTDLETSRAAVALAARRPDVHATVGLHPHDASRLEAEWPALLELAAAPEVVGIGEAGFDLHYNQSSFEDQEAAFRAQVRLAHETDHALVIHSREAWDDTFRVLEDEGPPRRTVFHCFTGGAREAERALALGTYLSFSGIVTFKNAADVRAAAARCPLDRLLVETDSPFLAPVPHRGRTNEPSYLPLVGEAIAAVKGCTVDEVRERTALSTAMLFSTAS